MTATAPARAMSNQEVATRLGLTQSGVSRLRSGSRVASTATLLEISKAFRVPVEDLVRAANELRANDNPEPWCGLLRQIFVTTEPAPGTEKANGKAEINA